MAIKIAPDIYWIKCYYGEAILYCFQLNIDGKTNWRIPTDDEYFKLISGTCWFRSTIETDSWYESQKLSNRRRCIPVMDL